ncbi:MAG: hypothetical protein Ct9H90mP24_5600 [Methanobacteriota archaeon]|nr:MAG: hypothetical protein Ct9H90mP24_5600 [Euryarchaeota archaeon]
MHSGIFLYFLERCQKEMRDSDEKAFLGPDAHLSELLIDIVDSSRTECRCSLSRLPLKMGGKIPRISNRIIPVFSP